MDADSLESWTFVKKLCFYVGQRIINIHEHKDVDYDMMSNAAFNVRTEHVWKPSCRKVWRCLSFRVMTWADSCCNVSRLFKDKLGHVTYHWSFFIWRNFLGCKCEVSESQHLQAFVCRGHCYVFFCIPLRRFSGTWISYIIREESLTWIWVISNSR